MLILTYKFIAPSFLQFLISIFTGVMKFFEIPVKSYFRKISDNNISAPFGLLGTISLMYIFDPMLFQRGGVEGILVKLLILCVFISLVFLNVGYFVDTRQRKVKAGVE